MISKIERLEASPTATILSQLGSAFGFSISEFLAEGADLTARLARRKDQQIWQDPETGYKRRAISSAAFPAVAYVPLHQQIWMLQGQLNFVEGPDEYVLAQGDCLQLKGAQDCVFKDRSRSKECRSVVGLIMRGTR